MKVSFIVRAWEKPVYVTAHRGWSKDHMEAKRFPSERAAKAYMAANPVDISWCLLPI